MAKRAKKRKYSKTETDLLVSEVKANQKVLFGALNVEIINERKNTARDKKPPQLILWVRGKITGKKKMFCAMNESCVQPPDNNV